MAAAAPSPLASSVEKINGAKLSRLLIDGGTTVLRNVFDGYHPPANLAADLNANYLTLNNLLRRRILRTAQWDQLFPPGGATPDSKTFDITLLFLLLTNICGLSPPFSGWYKPPPSSDTSLEANLARVKLYRNELYGHVTSTGVQTAVFHVKWHEVSAVLVALGLNPVEVVKLKSAPCAEDYISAVIEWAKNDEEIKSQLREVRETQQEGRQMQEEDHRTLQDTHKVVEEVLKTQQDEHQKQQQARQIQEDDHRILQDTHKTVEGVLDTQEGTHEVVEEVLKIQKEACGAIQEVQQTQQEVREIQREDRRVLEDTHKAVQDVRQIHQDTHQAVKKVLKTQEEVHHIQQEVRHSQQEAHGAIQEVVKTQKEDHETLQQVTKTVEYMKERSNDDKEGEILRKLAKINTQKVIEYHAERYQEGTRLSFFERVEKWLDDRISPNRVLVISGNAGMGKSVISSIVCKRMQETGRLSGSHFCQHDKARYRNAKVMLQSLACQLSDSLTEYRNALVKTLSRNLGVERNNMEVKEFFEVLFEEPLGKLKDPGRNILMVIDGLDESEYQGRNELLDVIANHFTKLPCWIRFLVTTRPEINIADSLKSFNPLQLEPNDEENLMDLRLLFEVQLSDVIQQDHQEVIISELVKKSEGLVLYAYLLVNFIKENVSLLTPEQLDSTLPTGISSVYQTYFQRLETELYKELKIKEEQFLTFLSALTAAREPLPLDFVSKIMLSGSSSLADRRKMRKVIACISALLPVRDDCIHFFHKSVKDWLIDMSLYGEHDFTVDEKEGHRVISELCTDELDDIKRKDVGSVQFSDTAKYALKHGVQHMLLLKQDARACEIVIKKNVVDLEIVYAKLRVGNEDILWIQQQEIAQQLSEDIKGMLNALSVLLRRNIYNSKFTSNLQVFLQTVLNEGGTLLSSVASNLLQIKYPEIPYMELVHKQMQQGAVLARFQCSSAVACLDVSPQLDYMVWECIGTIQLWSLHTCMLVWKRPVMVKKHFFFACNSFMSRILPSSSLASSLAFRSVVFHPTKKVVLPGVLSYAYTFDGDLKPLFPESNCSFTVCSISGDKTKMLTDCPDDAKCIIMWSLENGSEITRTARSEVVLSFAWSRDGKLLAISHSTGSISIVDAMDGFRTLTEIVMPEVCGMIKFSPDCRSLFCNLRSEIFRLHINMAELSNCTLYDCESYVPWDFELHSDAGYLLGDPISSRAEESYFVCSKQTVLRRSSRDNFIDMLNISELRKTDKDATFTEISDIVFSLTGETVYVVLDVTKTTVRAWDVSSGEFIAEKSMMLKGAGYKLSHECNRLVTVKAGVLFTTSSGSLELCNSELSQCVRNWTDINGITEMIPISEERMACKAENQVIILDTTSGEIVSKIPTFGHLAGCNSKRQLLTYRRRSLQLSDGKTTLWRKKCNWYFPHGIFSLSEQFVIIIPHLRQGKNMSVLDAISGETLHTLHIVPEDYRCIDLKFISDEECVISCGTLSRDYCLQLFNVKSGDLLSVLHLDSEANCLAACPHKRLLAIGQSDSKHGFKLIQVRLPQDKDIRKSKR